MVDPAPAVAAAITNKHLPPCSVSGVSARRAGSCAAPTFSRGRSSSALRSRATRHLTRREREARGRRSEAPIWTQGLSAAGPQKRRAVMPANDECVAGRVRYQQRGRPVRDDLRLLVRCASSHDADHLLTVRRHLRRGGRTSDRAAAVAAGETPTSKHSMLGIGEAGSERVRAGTRCHGSLDLATRGGRPVSRRPVWASHAAGAVVRRGTVDSSGARRRH